MKKIILIIEDEELMVRMYSKLFSFEGYAVASSTDGEHGLKKAKEENPDLIILDIMMPKMNGLEVLEALKSNPSTKDIPVVILTNLGNDETLKQSLQLGAVGYLVKSQVTNETLVDEIKQYIRSN
ncbi:MAG: response regulator [bacterium]|nr:response regulator [bacterium]